MRRAVVPFWRQPLTVRPPHSARVSSQGRAVGIVTVDLVPGQTTVLDVGVVVRSVVVGSPHACCTNDSRYADGSNASAPFGRSGLP